MANLVEYVKTVWENGKTALNAARMNNMEQGISNCATQINKLGDSVCQKMKIGNAGDGSPVTVETAGWKAGLYFVYSAAPFQENVSVLQMLVLKYKGDKCFISVNSGNASVNGTTITIEQLQWYSDVYCIQLCATE